MRNETFDALRPTNEAFFAKMKAYCDAHPELFGTAGAPDIRNKLWGQKGTTPDALDFPFAKAIGTPEVNAFARDNPFTEGLIENGFHCEFFPAPFKEDLKLLAPSKITMIDTRTA